MRKILLTAFAMAFVSVQAVSRLRKIVQERAEVAEPWRVIVTLAPRGDYEYKGCFADTEDRAIPNYTGWVKDADECRARAEANNHDVFGLQYRGQCFTGNQDTAYGKYGKGPDGECRNELGGTSTNMVYKRRMPGDAGPRRDGWQLKGCFKDDQSRTIPSYLGAVGWGDLQGCKALAEAMGFNTVGLQATECFGGKSPAYDRLGPAKCGGTWGGPGVNVVYALPSGYQYKGCFKDDGTRLIPKYLGDVASVDACKNLAVKGRFDTFSVQSDGECFVGNNPPYDRLGLETNKGNCPALGGDWSNQVYQVA